MPDCSWKADTLMFAPPKKNVDDEVELLGRRSTAKYPLRTCDVGVADRSESESPNLHNPIHPLTFSDGSAKNVYVIGSRTKLEAVQVGDGVKAPAVST